MKTFYYALYSVPAICLFILCLTPHPFDLGGGPWFGLQMKLILTIAILCPILTLGGLGAMAEAAWNRRSVKGLTILICWGLFPALVVFFAVGPIKS
jgi:hypothetical protein